jgi:TonB family protein
MRSRITALALALGASGLLLSGVAFAADAGGPVWEKAPDRSDWAKAYPAQAAQAGLSGDVKMRCAATEAGLLQNCTVVSETPSGQGFGAAALSLAGGMELKPTTADGKPVAGRSFMVPVKFDPAVLKGGVTITRPDWVRLPTDQELWSYMPAAAAADGGRALIHCNVTNRGLMQGCSLMRETPPGHGYGAAALAMAGMFVMRPMTVDGQPVGGSEINIPILWEAGSAPPAPQAIVKVFATAPWTAAPGVADMAAAFPKSSVGQVASAHVVMRCGIRDDGGLGSCENISELPSGRGFAHAANALIKDFRLPAAQKRGAYNNLRVDVPFDFRDPSQAAPPVEIHDPIWIQQVKPDSIVKLFPEAAIKAGYKVGRATVECAVAADGSLTGCATATEDPAGYGFGDAALVVAGVMRMSPWTKQGAPVEGARIALPVKFELPADAPAAAPPATAAPATP